MSRIISLDAFKRRKSMTVDDKIKEAEMGIYEEIDCLYDLVEKLRVEVSILKAKWDLETKT